MSHLRLLPTSGVSSDRLTYEHWPEPKPSLDDVKRMITQTNAIANISQIGACQVWLLQSQRYKVEQELLVRDYANMEKADADTEEATQVANSAPVDM